MDTGSILVSGAILGSVGLAFGALHRVSKGGAVFLDAGFDLLKEGDFPVCEGRAEALFGQRGGTAQLAQRGAFLALINLPRHVRYLRRFAGRLQSQASPSAIR